MGERVHSQGGAANPHERPPVEHSFPFGPEVLMTHSFPLEGFWIHDFDLLNDDTTRAHQAALYAVWVYCLGLHSGSVDNWEGLPGLPPIQTWEVIPLGKEEEYHTHSTLLQDTDFDDMRVHFLPAIGKYAAYYVAESKDDMACDSFMVRDAQGDCCVMDKFACNADGSLVLYDRSTQHAKVLHLYYLDWEHGALAYRFFYIGEDGRIYVFGGVGDEDVLGREHGGRYLLRERYEVEVMGDGRVRVAEKNGEE